MKKSKFLVPLIFIGDYRSLDGRKTSIKKIKIKITQLKLTIFCDIERTYHMASMYLTLARYINLKVLILPRKILSYNMFIVFSLEETFLVLS